MNADTKTLRLFIAIGIIPIQNLIDFYRILQNRLQNHKINWTPPENFHLTLKFLGETQANLIPEINNSLQYIAKNFKPFSISAQNLNIFLDRKKKKAKVIYLSFEPDIIIIDISKKINETFIPIGFKSNTPSFKIHLTLGRIKYYPDINELENILKSINKVEFTQEIQKFSLYKSILKNSSPEYKILNDYYLNQ